MNREVFNHVIIPPSVARSSQVPRCTCVYVCICMLQHLQLPQLNLNHKTQKPPVSDHTDRQIVTLHKQQPQSVNFLFLWNHPGHRSDEKFPAK